MLKKDTWAASQQRIESDLKRLSEENKEDRKQASVNTKELHQRIDLTTQELSEINSKLSLHLGKVSTRLDIVSENLKRHNNFRMLLSMALIGAAVSLLVGIMQLLK